MDKKLTLRDQYQISAFEHDEDLNAKRVIVVGGEMPEFKIPEIKLSEIKLPDFEIKTVEIPTIIVQKELQVEQVPTIVKEIEIREIEKPVVIVQKEIQIERVEVPVIVKQYESIEIPAQISQISSKESMPKWAIGLILIQSAIILLSVVLKFRI
jgi:hypothetical protein